MKNNLQSVIKMIIDYIIQIIGETDQKLYRKRLKYSMTLPTIIGRKVLKPWGSYTVFFTSKKCLIKKIMIEPGEQLSYQSHSFRNEHWVILCGRADIIIDGHHKTLSNNEYLYIPSGMKHRAMNKGSKNLTIIEIQTGEEFLEEDIIRYEDAYNRI